MKNPNWQEADQLAIYKHRQESELNSGLTIIHVQISNPAL